MLKKLKFCSLITSTLTLIPLLICAAPISGVRQNIQVINIATIITNTNMGELDTAPTIEAILGFIYQQAQATGHGDVVNDITVTKDNDLPQAYVTVNNDYSEYTGSVTITWTLIDMVNISDIVVNRVLIMPATTSDKSSLNKGDILNNLMVKNPSLRINQLDVNLSTDTMGPMYDATKQMWYINVVPISTSSIYYGNVAINVIQSVVPLSNYITKTNFGTIKLNVNGSTDPVDGPQVNDIKNLILSKNVLINEEFLDTLNVSNIALVDGEGGYGYSASITCDTTKAPFIDPINNSINIKFYAVQENFFARYTVSGGTKTWSTQFQYKNTSKQVSTITNGIIPNPTTTFTIYDQADEWTNGQNAVIIGRNNYDGIIFYSNYINRLRYCAYQRSTAFDVSLAHVPEDFTWDVSASKYNTLYTGDLNLGNSGGALSRTSYIRHKSYMPPKDTLDIWSEKMSGNEYDKDGSNGTYFASPIINLHLPFGSTYKLNRTGKYNNAYTVGGKAYPVGYVPVCNIFYDNN